MEDDHVHSTAHHGNGDVHISTNNYLYRHQLSNNVFAANTLPRQYVTAVNTSPLQHVSAANTLPLQHASAVNTLPMQHTYNGCNSVSRIKVATV